MNENDEIVQGNIENIKSELDEFKDKVKSDMKSNEDKMNEELNAVKEALKKLKLQPQQPSNSVKTYGMPTEDKEAVRHLTDGPDSEHGRVRDR